MQTQPATFVEILKRWDTSELAAHLNLKDGTVRQWRLRAIPPGYWLEVVDFAQKRGDQQITLRLLATIAAHDAGRPVRCGVKSTPERATAGASAP